MSSVSICIIKILTHQGVFRWQGPRKWKTFAVKSFSLFFLVMEATILKTWSCDRNYSPARQGWRDIDGLFVENRHLEMLLLYSVAALFCRRTFWLASSNLPALLFSFCIFALIYPVYDISYSQFFCDVFIIYIFLLVSVGQRVVLNSISRFFFVERVPEVFLQHIRMRHGWWKICLAAVIRMRNLCKHIFASAERKFNTVIPSLGDTLTSNTYARVF